MWRNWFLAIVDIENSEDEPLINSRHLWQVDEICKRDVNMKIQQRKYPRSRKFLIQYLGS